jgi:hypothetical protein
MEKSVDSRFYLFGKLCHQGGRCMSETIHKINDLKLLRNLLTQDEEGLQEYLYDKLRVGNMWWIPDDISKFGQGDTHPWIVVVDYKPNHPPILACPRTTKIGKRSDEFLTPAHVLPDLEKEGAILLTFRRSFATEKFREFDYIGRLPDDWLVKFQQAFRTRSRGVK